jgi:hypothetical protein
MRPAWAGGLLAVLVGGVLLPAASAQAGSVVLRPTPKPTTKVPPGHASPSPTPSATVQATTTPATTPSSAPPATAAVVATVSSPVATSPPARPRAVIVAPAPAPRPSLGPSPVAARPVARHQPRRDDERLSDVAHSFARVATASPQLPLGVIGAVLLFLVVQNRIDRKDPKLAITDASSSVELDFRPVRRRLPEPERRRVPLTIRPVPGPVAATDTTVDRGPTEV